MGKVVSSSNALDTDSRTYLVEIHIPNPQGLLVPGIYAEVTIKPAPAVYRLQIPANALIFDSMGMHVAELSTDSGVHFQPVKIVSDNGKEMEFAKGLTPSTKVILLPSDTLVKGMTVKPISPNRSYLLG